MTKATRAANLSILDAGGLGPRRARRAKAGVVWALALLLALAVHLAFVLRVEERPAEEEPPESPEGAAPIVVSQESAEALLGEDAVEPETPQEDAPAPAGEAAEAEPVQSAAAVPPPPSAAEEGEPTEQAPSPAPREPEVLDAPDPSATITSLLEGNASNPAPDDADLSPSQTNEATGEATSPAPAPSDPTEAEPPQTEAEPAQTEAEPADDPSEAVADTPAEAPTGAPVQDAPAPAPADTRGSGGAPALALPDIDSAFQTLSGEGDELVPPAPDEDGSAEQRAAVQRPSDTFYPFPATRPSADARASTFSQAEAGALESVPRPSPNPLPPEQRAAATPQAAPAEQAPTTGAPAAAEVQASYARAVRAIVGQAFFSAARYNTVGEGTAIVTITIARDGTVLDATLSQRSGNALLDSAVLAAAYNSFPAFPPNVADRSLSFSVPIRVR